MTWISKSFFSVQGPGGEDQEIRKKINRIEVRKYKFEIGRFG